VETDERWIETLIVIGSAMEAITLGFALGVVIYFLTIGAASPVGQGVHTPPPPPIGEVR
jgi:hypothetical protein